jgi:DNA-binding LacI/PurR family transcriptional regulator
LTTVHQDVQGMVTRALDVLLKAIRSGSGDRSSDGYDLGGAHETLSPDLRIRESTAAQVDADGDRTSPDGRAP